MGATQASAGILAPYIEAHDDGPLLDLTTRSLGRFDAFIEGIKEKTGAAVLYHRNGTLDVALHDDTLARFERTAATLATKSIAAELVDARDARVLEPHLTADVRGGLLIHGHGFVAAAPLVRALVAAARHHGAHILESGRIQRVRHAKGELVIDTSRGPLRGTAAVLAAGCWSGEIAVEGAAKVPVRPVRGQLLELGWVGIPPRRVTWSERCYLVPWDDGTVLVGATVEDAGFDERATVAGVHDLIDAASEVVPHIWTAGFKSARVGLRPGTPDDLPIIGSSTVVPHLMYATGHYRNGVLLAPLTAEIVADALLANRIDPIMNLTRPGRFGDL